MKFLLHISVVLMITGCNSEHAHNRELLKNDSLSQAKRARSDAQAKADSLEGLIAIGNIKFGISPKQFVPAKNAFLKGKFQPADENYYIGDYRFKSISPEFADSKLYQVVLSGMPLQIDELDVLDKQALELYEILEAKYGKASSSYKIVKAYNVPRFHWASVADWKKGNKTVDLKISHNYDSYSVDLLIYKNDVHDRLEQKDRAAVDSVKKAAIKEL